MENKTLETITEEKKQRNGEGKIKRFFGLNGVPKLDDVIMEAMLERSKAGLHSSMGFISKYIHSRWNITAVDNSPASLKCAIRQEIVKIVKKGLIGQKSKNMYYLVISKKSSHAVTPKTNKIEELDYWYLSCDMKDEEQKKLGDKFRHICEQIEMKPGNSMKLLELDIVNNEILRNNLLYFTAIFVDYFAKKFSNSKKVDQYTSITEVFDFIFTHSNVDERTRLACIVNKYFRNFLNVKKYVKIAKIRYSRFFLWCFWYSNNDTRLSLIKEAFQTLMKVGRLELWLLIAIFNYFDDTEYTKTRILKKLVDNLDSIMRYEANGSLVLLSIVNYLISPCYRHPFIVNVDEDFMNCGSDNPFTSKSSITILSDLRAFIFPYCLKYVTENIDLMLNDKLRALFLASIVNNSCDFEAKHLMITIIDRIKTHHSFGNVYEICERDTATDIYIYKEIVLQNSVLKFCEKTVDFDKFLYNNIYENNTDVILFSKLFIDLTSDELLMEYTKSTNGLWLLHLLWESNIPDVQKKICSVVESCKHFLDKSLFGVRLLLKCLPENSESQLNSNITS